MLLNIEDTIDWLSQRHKDFYIEFHGSDGWQVALVRPDKEWGHYDCWIKGDGSLSSALLKAVELTRV